MKIAIVGTGFVADQYLLTLRLHPELEVAGVLDRDEVRGKRFSDFYSVPLYGSLQEILEDRDVQIVVNLTNPRSHFKLTRTCLEAGKHVYSEKPLAMDFAQAKSLVAMARGRGLQLASAPCTFLGETAQTMGRALREGVVGRVRVVYAEMDDGLLHRMRYRTWVSASGTPWPWKDELEVGCTLEHSGYCLTWLAGFFGPAESVTAFSSTLIADKHTDFPLEPNGPDLSVAAIRFHCGVVARLTCSIVAPHDHRFLVVGDDGILWTNETWRSRAPVYHRKYVWVRRRMMLSAWKRRYPLLGKRNPTVRYGGASHIDFARGIADLAEAIDRKREPRLGAHFSLHCNELALAIHGAGENAATYRMTTTFEPVEPMPWAAA
jgi:predicted dehydrogenase